MRPNSPAQADAIERLRTNPGGSYYLHGAYSLGKTHLMVAQYQHLALAGTPCLLRSSRQLADEMRRAEITPSSGEEPYESPVLQMLMKPKHCHLFVDDLEKTPARTDFRAEATFYWLDTLKRHCHGLTVTSNRPLQDLTGILGDAAVARIYRIWSVISLWGHMMPKSIPDKNFYRPDELARVADLPIKTVYRLMRRGLVQHVHIGRSARIPRQEFIRILNGGVDLSRSVTAKKS
jgi:DNA replication protein DnaC